jgi:phosphatidate cytidylyltransferase
MNNNLIQRILTALVAGTAAVAAIIWSPYGLWLFCTLIAMAGLREFLPVAGLKDRRYWWPVLGAGLGIWALELWDLWQGGLDPSWYLLPVLLLLPVSLLQALFNVQEKNPAASLGGVVLALSYCFLPLVMFFEVAVSPEKAYDFWVPLGLLLLIWALDSGAYFAGRTLGRHLFFPRVSPKKTWEGAIGGLLCCLAVGLALQHWLAPPNFHWLVPALLVGILGQLGDLVESMFKRSAQIKDSGSLLPGHGGILDRFDGLYLLMPFVFLYFTLI